MKGVVFSSVGEARAAFSLGPVRFKCGVCGKVHRSSGRGWTPCASRLQRRCSYIEFVRPQVPVRPLAEQFGQNPFYYPVAWSALGLPWEARAKLLCGTDLVKELSPALLAVPDPGAALAAALEERRRVILASFPSFKKEVRAYGEFLEWVGSPDPVFEVSPGDPYLFLLRGRFLGLRARWRAFALSSWHFYASDWAACMASAAGLEGVFKLVRFEYSGRVLRAVLKSRGSKTAEVSLAFGPGGLL